MAKLSETLATPAVEEARRQIEVCNACRYCEGYCAVFPAMELRRAFSDGDIHYLANLCHNCRSCYYACQYASPHPFELNPPKALSEVRSESYQRYAWPSGFARLLSRNGVVVSLVTSLSIALVLILAVLLQTPDALFGTHTGPGAFYAVASHNVMVYPASALFLFAMVALLIGFQRFWSQTSDTPVDLRNRQGWIQALKDVATLRYLGNDGAGCAYPNGAFSNARRRFHHMVMYGFLLCFTATSVATLYDYVFGWLPPYDYLSLPVILGTVGGVGLIVGCTGLFWIKFTSDQAPAAKNMLGMDVSFIMLLFFVSLTGLLLLGLRETPAMGMLLMVHLGFVLGLFLLLPYCKFVHGIYRLAALIRYAIEDRNAEHDAPE
ncbi:MAG: tricarballylate utilization 4Fe-4S protein TcuB [Candidatus Sedimenticola sp. PURPLELP]